MAADTSQPLLVLLSQGAVPANGQTANGQSILGQLSNGTLPDTVPDTAVPPIVNTSG